MAFHSSSSSDTDPFHLSQTSTIMSRFGASGFPTCIYDLKVMSIDRNVSTGFKTGDHLDKMRLPLGSITSNLENSAKKKKGEVVNGFEILMGYIEMGTIEIISLEDIKLNKKASGRLKDLNDLENLE